MERISKEEYYLGIAEAVAKRATCLRRNYGAIIIKNDEIISTGYTGSPRGQLNCIDLGQCDREDANIPSGQRYEMCRSVHAEMNALISAARRDIIGGTIYIVGFEVKTGVKIPGIPCSLCNRMLINSGLKTLVTIDNVWGFAAKEIG